MIRIFIRVHLLVAVFTTITTSLLKRVPTRGESPHYTVLYCRDRVVNAPQLRETYFASPDYTSTVAIPA